ncbi:xylulokinase [Deinococcus arenae]|uniref:Xylulose kinase n=1 Tax=Deinococcus arenae TaxID=1452751 RepID=A0A8H9GQD2_9DEIO|nr:xylulokinase [Deinococcus arenae]AWT34340.1 xylulokinase [Deinococcus actinosclerus]GGM47961.1 xylulokinase [Deinococcus arenae]
MTPTTPTPLTPVTLGLDVGTSGVKAVAVTASGDTLAESTHPYPLLTPRPGWTEQRPADWLGGVRAALRDLSAALEGRAQPLALGLSGQMHGLVPLDAQGEVLRPALLWNDQRTGAQVEQIEARVPRAELVARTGNRAVTGFQLPKILWLRDEEPATFDRLRHALIPKDYVGFVLTGVMAAEPSDASGVGALNLARGAWDTDVLGALDLTPDLFPPLLRSTDVVGTLTREWAAATGLPEGLPVVAGGGDNAAAGIALGLSSARPDVGSVSLGTSGVIFSPLRDPTPDPGGRVHLFAHADGGYHLLGVTLSAAGSLEWLHAKLAPDTPISVLLEEAAQVTPGAGGVTFLPYLSGERSPLMNPHARAAFTGLSLAHGRAHLTRAVLEGSVAALADAYGVMQAIAPLNTLISTGGGARSDLWLGLASGALSLPVHPTAQRPGAAHGAAILAMPAAGLHPGLAAAMDATRPDLHPPVQPVDMADALSAYAAARTALYGV